MKHKASLGTLKMTESCLNAADVDFTGNKALILVVCWLGNEASNTVPTEPPSSIVSGIFIVFVVLDTNFVGTGTSFMVELMLVHQKLSLLWFLESKTSLKMTDNPPEPTTTKISTAVSLQ